MALFIESRDENGALLDRVRFNNGIATFTSERDTLTLDEAVCLARLSVGLPLEKRSWVLRIDVDH